MKIKLYVDWMNEEILNEKEYEKEILEYAEGREKDDSYSFAEFLDDYLEREEQDLAYLFNVNEKERKKILELWKENCLEVTRENFDDNYKVIEIEV